MSIRVETAGPVTTFTIDRPQARNALDNRSAAELAAAFRAFDADDDQKVGVLTGAGGAFCAGADLKEMADGATYQPWATAADGPTAQLLSKPVIAAVAGHACAGGLGLALWCDIRIAEESAVFGVFSRRWGVPMSDGTTVRLPRLIGMGPALDMLITGRPVGAAEARQLGLCTRVVPDGSSLAEARKLAAEIARFPEVAMRSDRASTYAQAGLPLAEALRRETELSLEAKRREAVAGAARFRAGAGRHGSRDG